MVSKVKCFTYTGQKHWEGGLTLKVHRLGKLFHRGHKRQNKNSSSVTLPQSPKKKVGATAPCD